MSRRIAIGTDLYLFTANGGPSEFLLISAHGSTKNSTFTVPNWTRLHFYAPEKHTLVHPMKMFQLGVKVEEEIEPNRVSRNYSLTKYQGRHGGKLETYESLGELIDTTRQNIAMGRPQMQQIPGDATKGQIENFKNGFKEKIRAYENLIPFDFLTIRNLNPYNKLSSGTNLKNVLDQLNKSGYRYPYIFCSFCRGVIFGNKGKHEAKTY